MLNTVNLLQKSFAARSLDEAKDCQRLKNVLNRLQEPIDRIERDRHRLRDGLGRTKRTRILQWISPMPHHNQARKDLVADSGPWFLSDDRLLGWRGSSTWLRGIAGGSGKSRPQISNSYLLLLRTESC